MTQKRKKGTTSFNKSNKTLASVFTSSLISLLAHCLQAEEIIPVPTMSASMTLGGALLAI